MKKYVVRVWTEYNRLRIRTNRGLLWTRQWAFGFHERWRNYWSAERL